MNKGKFFLYAPRVLAILCILLLNLFFLSMLDNPNQGFKKNIFEFFIYSIPSLALIAALVVAWKYELVGAAVFIFTALALSLMTVAKGVSWSEFGYSLLISCPLLITGILFYISWYIKKKGD